MLSKTERISHWQAIVILFSMTYTIMMRAGVSIMASEAKQAAWLSPVFIFIVFITVVFIMNGIYRSQHSRQLCLMDIMKNVFGKYVTYVILAFYFIYITVMLANVTRFYSARFSITIFTEVDRIYFIGIMFVLVAVALEFGLGLLARMNEIIFPILLIIFTFVFLGLLSQVRWGNLWPVTYKDIVPAAKGSLGALSPILFYPYLYFSGDRINNKKDIKKDGIKAAVFFLIVTIWLAVMTVGTLGYRYIEKMQIPFLVAVKHVKFFDVIQRLESVSIAEWIISDFILIAILVYTAVNILKWAFKLKETRSVKNIYLVLIGVMTYMIALNIFRLADFGKFILFPLNFIFGFGIPLAVLVIGKIRKVI